MQSNFFRYLISRSSVRVLIVLFFTATFGRMALAANDLDLVLSWTNNSVLVCPSPDPIPNVHTINFINNNSITINFQGESGNTEFYEPWDTINYTNNGTMTVNSGFKFDTLDSDTGFHSMAGSIYNAGSINCANDTNVFNLFGVGQFIGLLGVGQFIGTATNIVNPGAIDVGFDCKIQLTGQNVDLSHGTFAIRTAGSGATSFGSGFFGLNTNGWSPEFSLTETNARSSFLPRPPYQLYLTNTTAYIDVSPVDASNNVIQAVFLQDTSGSNVNCNVYFDDTGTTFGSRNVVVEWVGSSLDSASGQSINSYFYLTNDYVLAASTNVALINGYPDNFSFGQSSAPLIFLPPTAPGFMNIFPGFVSSNFYAFGDIQLSSSTVSTNVSYQNPSGALTNLPGQILITAGHHLNLDHAEISGVNYLSVQATNQFDGNTGARIVAPYSDIGLGATNGFLTVSNFMLSTIPNWSGNIQAWSTRWISVDNGVTNDYRVLLVGSRLSPGALPYIQDLVLHATNSLVLADQFNVLRNLSIDAQNLTLTTNTPGNGAMSLNGELNILPPIAWAGAAPNIVNLTNDGAIRIEGGIQAQFGNNTTLSVTNVVPGTSQAQATGMLSELSGTNVEENAEVTIGTNTYTFVSEIKSGKHTPQTPDQIKIAPTFDGTMSNLIMAINQAPGSGTNTYSTNTVFNHQAQVYPYELSNHSFMVLAYPIGSAGNSVVTTTTSTNLTWNGRNTLLGGMDETPAITNVVTIPPHRYKTFINHGIVSDSGADVWADSFLSSGVFSNGVGSFTLQAPSVILTNGLLDAGGDIAITADTLVTSNLTLHAGRLLTLTATNLLTDDGLTNGNTWTVGDGVGYNGISLPLKPAVGDLLGTTITNIARSNIVNHVVWAGEDRGISADGFVNNEAIGRLILDSRPDDLNPLQSRDGKFSFKGAGANNAIYVDYLELRGALTNGIEKGFDLSDWITIDSNITIYFAQAVINGVSIADKLDEASRDGKNNGRLRWVPQYAGQFSSEQIIYLDGTTNTFNAALASSTTTDSDGDGNPNAGDPTPFFTASQIDKKISCTNGFAVIQWSSIPAATNIVYYSTNMTTWLTLTNFVSPTNVPPVGGWPITNIIYDPIVSPSQFYNVTVIPNSALFYGQ